MTEVYDRERQRGIVQRILNEEGFRSGDEVREIVRRVTHEQVRNTGLLYDVRRDQVEVVEVERVLPAVRNAGHGDGAPLS